MKSEDKTVINFVRHCDGQLILPIYQRDFIWDTQQYSQFFKDILEAENGHWIDRIVIKEFKPTAWLPGNYFEIHLIDGQQRLTSFLTLCTAMCAWCKHNNFEGIPWKEQIHNKLLKTDFEGKLKLKLRGDNDRLFNEFVNDLPKFGESKAEKTREGRNNTNLLLSMYNYFYSEINENNICLLFDNIRKLETIEVICESKDDGQKIFHSINYYGKPLATYEVIRNLSLMNMDYSTQKEYDDCYWKDMYDYFVYTKDRKNQFEGFFVLMLRYLTGHNKKSFNKDYALAYLIKNYFNTQKYAEFFEEMKKLFKLYLTFKGVTPHYDANIRKCLNDLSRLKGDSATYPLLFKLFNKYDEGMSDISDLINALNLLKTHILRNKIVGKSAPDSLNININEVTNNLTYSLCVLLIKHTGKISDEYFKNELIQYKKWYTSSESRSITKYVLEEIENTYHSKEKINFKQSTIEHIMPQTLSDGWKQELGSTYEMIHSTYLNKLGNLTIAPYNSKLSNELFSEKKNMEDGFESDRNYLSKHICKYDKWDQYSIESRTEYLANKICELFKYPDTNILLEEKSKQTVLMSAK